MKGNLTSNAKAFLRNLFLGFVICLSGVAISMWGTAVEAAANPYPSTQDVDGDGYYEVPCTYFAWQQVYDNYGIALPAWGNAVNWWNAARNAGYQTGSEPRAGSIAVWSGDYYGHVAYVTSGSGSVFTVNEGGRTDLDHTASHGVKYGYTLTNWVGGKRPYDPGKTLLGFIYVSGSPTANVSYAGTWVNWVDTWNAEIAGKISNPDRATITQVGALIWDSNGTCVVNHAEDCGLNYSTINQTLNVVGEALPSGLRQGETYTFQLWAKAGNQTYSSDKNSFTIQDIVKPAISNVRVTNITSDGYTVICTATDNYKVDRVQFPTWTIANGQDDLAANWGENVKCRGTQNGNEFTFRVNRADHNGEYGAYVTHIYAYDKAGNYVCTHVDRVELKKVEITQPPVKEPEKEPVNEPAEDPVKDPVKDPVEEPITDPVKDPVNEPVETPVETPTQPTQNGSTGQGNKKAKVTKFTAKAYTGKVILKWNRVKKATGYRIYRSVKKNSGYKLIKKFSKNTFKYTDRWLKRKKVYYYKIAPTIKSGGKTYVGSSVKIKVKTK